MEKQARPDFLLQKIYSDGQNEAPTVYHVHELEGDWAMGRRGFLAISAIGVAFSADAATGHRFNKD
ncbi:hypothetical protein [Desulfosarcina cetonica]|uniref:hypothetical protein n=1 Tax=Desulfosarcina cetonica TaxID=90730 RepID=UPI0012ECD326|nr:hypothetical protein [Desulfosarcina cetonica]